MSSASLKEYEDSDEEETLLTTVEYYTLDNMIEKTGGFGRLQIAILVCMLIANIPTAFYSYGLPVLEQFPDYVCTTDSGMDYRCKRNQICINGMPKESMIWGINWDSSRSINNWVDEMDLMCATKFQIGLFGSIYFLGFAFSGVFLKFSDHFGRRKIIQVGCLFSCFIVTYLYSFSGLYARYTMLFCLGALSFRLLALYILISELCPVQYRIYVSAGYALIDHYIGVLLPAIYFRFIGKDYKVIFSCAVFAAPLSFILSMFLPESPRYLYEKRKIDQLRKEFEKIAEFNRVRIPSKYELILNDGTSVEDDDNNFNRNLCKMIKNFKICMNLLVSTLTVSIVSLDNNLLQYHSKYFQANNYDVAFLMLHAEIIGTIIAVFLRKWLSTRVLIVLSFLLISACTLPLILIPQVDSTTMISVFGCQMGISMVFYLSLLNISENFPPLFVALAFFVCNLCGSMANIFSPILAEATHPVPMKIMFGASIAQGLLNIIYKPKIST
ncbi:unnamed protein product [Moneuplotes crassus]|uniref:Uncharacterized protein n=1 Tax=Euplotes crassus TaxID=5936 RepID=A0AAD1UL52_EUPCR|nr:unnamed protein product [Moneuplotes crassus]